MTSLSVLITGALSGIGRATAFAFAREKHRIVVSGRDDAKGAALAKELGALGVECAFVRADVQDEEQVRNLVDATVQRFGGLDAAFNCAGTEGNRLPIVEQSAETFASVFNTNVLGTLLCLKHEMRVMCEQRHGSIINMSSTLGSRGAPGTSLYSSSKHAVEGLTKCAALECGEFNVRVNAVAPGPIETPLLDRFIGTGDFKAAMMATIPLKRSGTPEEVAQTVVFLASGAASYVSGHIFAVNGGQAAR